MSSRRGKCGRQVPPDDPRRLDLESSGGMSDGPPATAVREWCINSAAIDIPNKSAIVNNEDGVLYRWDFTTNTLSQQIRLTQGVGEAYTPTLIGPDGTVYAINDAVLFAIGNLHIAATGHPKPQVR